MYIFLHLDFSHQWLIRLINTSIPVPKVSPINESTTTVKMK